MHQLTPCQDRALQLLQTSHNVFVTGIAGSGKSYLIQQFLKSKTAKTFPVLASTGAAAILVGGRTFHSFFGLGVMEGGVTATVERALKEKRVLRRLRKVEGVVVDEVSMLPASALRAAEEIARKARDSSAPWGGMQVIVVGDFAQLPPVAKYGETRQWAFDDEIWERSDFVPAPLKTVVRTREDDFLEVLNDIRNGVVTNSVKSFLDSRIRTDFEELECTRLFGRRDPTEKYNLEKLRHLDSDPVEIPTTYSGAERFVEILKKQAPIPEVLVLKTGALIMLRQNDPKGRWINGSIGIVNRIQSTAIEVALKSGAVVEIEKASFSIQDADGNPTAVAVNYPMTLAYAVTIHKAQGATLDAMVVDVRGLWEPGQAYVALSRVRTAGSLWLTGWDEKSIRADNRVKEFYRKIFLTSSV